MKTKCLQVELIYRENSDVLIWVENVTILLKSSGTGGMYIVYLNK